MPLPNEIRFKVSDELADKVRELEGLGEFDSLGASARFVLSATIDNVIAQFNYLKNGNVIASTQPTAPEPQKQQTPAQQTSTPTQQTLPAPGAFGNSFSGLKTKVAS